MNSLRGRLGMMVGKDIVANNHKVKLYGTLDMFHEFAGKQGVTVEGYELIVGLMKIMVLGTK